VDVPEKVMLFPLWYVVFVLSLTCHEAAHAFVAYRGGDPTAYLGGQVTLNPIPHIRREPFGTLLAPLVTYAWMGWMMGWASAPYDPQWEDRHPGRAALMAAAGPLANLVLFVIAFVALRVGLSMDVWEPAYEGFAYDRIVVPVAADAGVLDPLGRLLSITMFLNLVLFVFNLFPMPPLDGSAVLAGLFPGARRLRDTLRSSGMGILGLLAAWTLFGYVFEPVATFVLRMLWT
jgi:Zn-dependent protease